MDLASPAVSQTSVYANGISHSRAYVDGIICYSNSFDLHLKQLSTVLQKLTKTGFTVNASKCNFYKTEKSFLGHRVSEGEWPLFPKELKLF